MKMLFALLISVGFAAPICQAATSTTMERYFSQNANAKKLGFNEVRNGVKTSIKLLNCSDLDTDPAGYGVCTFQASGYMLNGVYSVVVYPQGYGFAAPVEVGNFLD
jgi:hypothetical protein